MEAVLDVDNIAYCAIEIEGARMPATANLIDSIYIQDGGFGCPIPILKLILNDQTGSLDEDLNLQDGTKISIKLAKQRESVKVRKFRVFHFAKQTTSAGPKMTVTCIYDAPKWTAGVYTESYRGSSDSVIGQLAASAGLEYDGAGGTDDVMTWLNINKTRTAFSEDIAMRGYASEQSCMYRVLTVDNKVKYKDVYKSLSEAPKWSLHQNTDEATASATPIVIRETQNASASGLSTHMMNYGQYQYEHSLDVAGQTSTTGLNAPVFGSALPINSEVRGEISDRGARVNYTGWDTGTEPKPASNLHHEYEPSMYQNLRYLGLLSERIKVLTDEYTETETFDCVEYKHADAEGAEFKEKKALAGKWLIGGRTIWIKAGHKYCEVFFLYRPTLMETGSTDSAGAQSPRGEQNATANNGDIDLVAEARIPETPAAVAAPETPGAAAASVAVPDAPKATAPAVQHAKDMLKSLNDYAAQNPLNSPPVMTQQPPGQLLATENVLRDNVQKTQNAGGPISDIVAEGKPDNITPYMTLKKFGADTINSLAQKQPRELARDTARLMDDPAYAKSSAIHRVTDLASDVTGVRMHNVVAAASGRSVSPGAVVGDVMNGGYWADDLRAAGISPEQIQVPLPVELPMNENVAEFGGTFLYSTTNVGLKPNQVLINPHAVASGIERWSRETNPEALLAEKGYKAYTQTFGNISPNEAGIQLEELGALSAKTAMLYSRNELLIDEGLDNPGVRELGRDVAFVFGDPSITPVVNSVERVVDYGEYHDVQSQPQLVTWADYYSMGKDLGEAAQWRFPFGFPGDTTSVTNHTNGNVGTFSNEVKQWNGQTAST